MERCLKLNVQDTFTQVGLVGASKRHPVLLHIFSSTDVAPREFGLNVSLVTSVNVLSEPRSQFWTQTAV